MISYGPSITTNGLSLLADASNIKSYPGTGSTWSDLSNNGNDLTLTGSPTFTNPYPGGQSITTDGSTSYISSPLQFILPFTLSLTTKVLSFSSNYLIFFRSYFGSVSGFCVNVIDSTHFSVTFFTPSSNYVVNITQDINSLPFTLDIVVDKNKSGFIYVNGVLRDSSLVGRYVNPLGYGLLLGTADIPGAAVSANFYRVALYNRALTQSEIQTNFNAMRGRYGI